MSISNSPSDINSFTAGKSAFTLSLLDHFVSEYQKIGHIILVPSKSMIGIATPSKKVAWITQLGKSFIHVVFPFKRPYPENFCFQKIVQVPGDDSQFNHHFRMLQPDDVNEEIRKFMKLALEE
jgi:hypothetical protein